MNRKSILILLSAFVFAIAFVNSATYVVDDRYHWTCLTKGEKLAKYTCTSDCCITCQKNGYTAPWYNCEGSPCSCGSTGAGDLEPPVLQVINPVDGFISDKRSVDFYITTNEKADYFYKDMSDERRGYRKFCTKCEEYNDRISFPDGWHTIIIMASDYNNNQADKQVTFLIDSKKPRIKKTLPKAKAYCNGTFVIQYDEENLKNISLFYNEGSGYTGVTKTDCPSGLRQECTFFVPALNQGPLNYYFMISDNIYTVQSKEVKVNVDTVVPTMTITKPEPTTYERYVEFDINVDEEVTLEYWDYALSRPRWSRLCAKCDNYSRKKGFTKGDHTLDIRATDPAGNSVIGTVSFTVV
ncbi:MAG: hypothetical protein QXR60_02565 [Candidatus Nanoarchaeia archaeon]